MRSLKEQEAELANLRQSSQLNQTTLQQERDKTQKEMSSLQSQLQEKVSEALKYAIYALNVAVC